MEKAFLSRYWARQIDERAIDEYGMTGLVLMENAGRGCAELLHEIGIHGPVVICCGRGNNAGDGFVIARHLDARGYLVRLLLTGEPEHLRGDAAINYAIAELGGLKAEVCPERGDRDWLRDRMADADWLVDCLLGTGSSGAPRWPIDVFIEGMNETAAKKMAVDLPSGLDCDSGEPARPTFRAEHTATFVAPKIGFRNPAAVPVLGTVHIVDIGCPRKLVREILGRCDGA